MGAKRCREFDVHMPMELEWEKFIASFVDKEAVSIVGDTVTMSSEKAKIRMNQRLPAAGSILFDLFFTELAEDQTVFSNSTFHSNLDIGWPTFVVGLRKTGDRGLLYLRVDPHPDGRFVLESTTALEAKVWHTVGVSWGDSLTIAVKQSTRSRGRIVAPTRLVVESLPASSAPKIEPTKHYFGFGRISLPLDANHQPVTHYPPSLARAKVRIRDVSFDAIGGRPARVKRGGVRPQPAT